ncbi:SDR family NAD(P)-dependent oxidoreductase [Streptomyces sp. LN704]|uniref:SDR family NAD(P)-dependent oxidoreductase n=1 Tax=Streptomyces sp. LN704 TaxID=3112982 RepID=UPI003713899A
MRSAKTATTSSSIARTFGTHGYGVALIARNRAKLENLAGELTAEGITAAAFPADVLDRDALTQALKDAAAHFGGIDVLEYSPVGGFASTVLTTPSATEPSHVQHEMEFQLYGAIAASQAVLPAMRKAGAGTLLFTTGAGSIDPVPQVANVNAAAAALRNWGINLHKELDGRHRRPGRPRRHRRVDRHVGRPWVPHGQARGDLARLLGAAHHPPRPGRARLQPLTPRRPRGRAPLEP